MTGRNQWTGRPRCGETMKSGPRKGESCDRICTHFAGLRLVCTNHYEQWRKKTGTPASANYGAGNR